MTRRVKLKTIITMSVLERSKMVVNGMHYYFTTKGLSHNFPMYSLLTEIVTKTSKGVKSPVQNSKEENKDKKVKFVSSFS